MLKAETTKLKENKVNLEDFLHETTWLKKEVHAHIKGFGDFNNRLKTTENYIHKYEPLRCQVMITETLESTLGQIERKKLKAFNRVMFNRLDKAILDDEGEPAVLELIK